MNLIKRMFGSRRTRQQKLDPPRTNSELLRQCHFEVMEPRQLLDADPVIAGITYLEDDAGQDTTPDFFEVTFEGGAATTQMTSFIINGDQDQSGDRSLGDIYFDVDSTAPGTSSSHPFTFIDDGSAGIAAHDILGIETSADGLSLTVHVQNFSAGDKLRFSLDVDEIESTRDDKIVSGVEFEGTGFSAVFVDDNYVFNSLNVPVIHNLDDGGTQAQREGVFYDEYNTLLGTGNQLAGSTLNLSLDNQLGASNRTAGAIAAYELEAKPVVISGHVFHDENLDCDHDGNESGIENVTIHLQKFNASSASYETVATTTTNGQGYYEFGTDLDVKPGKFRLVEQQPNGYLDVGASAGTVDGEASGAVKQNAAGQANIIANIEIPLGGTVAENYDFKEIKPASMAGTVYHDRNDNGLQDGGEEGIANVLIRVTRVGAKDASIDDPFADSTPIFVRTDSLGRYQVDALPPGIYEVIEINNYPNEVSPLVDFIDGKDSVGRIDGQPSQAENGQKTNDRFHSIVLCADKNGIEYNFGELKPVSISGYVSVATPVKPAIVDPTDPDFQPIQGVFIQLFDQDNNLVSTTRTDADGHYQFDGMAPATYTVVEVQPDAYLDAGTSLGTVAGAPRGSDAIANRFTGIRLQSGDAGVQYNFCEHLPASISGYVAVENDAKHNGIVDPTHSDFQPIADVEIQLFDNQNQWVATTKTGANGFYRFDGLPPGDYRLVEVQPDGYFDAATHVGTIGGVTTGLSTTQNHINQIRLEGGDRGIQYNFCEHLPASINGNVWHDLNDDGVRDPGEPLIADVTIQLFDADGSVVAETVSARDGSYEFDNLTPGFYTVREIQPDGYVDGKDALGSVGGSSSGNQANDVFRRVQLGSGQRGVNYDFGEIRPASIEGYVFVDGNGDCRLHSPGDRPLADVTILLLDADGQVIQRTRTDSDGFYSFGDLRPGEYSVRQIQPSGVIDGSAIVGDVNGLETGTAGQNRIDNIDILSGERGVHFDFCESEPAAISGRVFRDGPVFRTSDGAVPENYRSLRDGTYQAATDAPLAGVRMQLYYYIDPDTNSIDPRPVTVADLADASSYTHLTTSDPTAPVWVVTDAHGEYQFDGLKAGNYIVAQSQPDGFVDANDTPGTTTGLAFNSLDTASTAPQTLLSTFSNQQLMDTIVNVRVDSGEVSLQNNFSEVLADRDTFVPPNYPPPPQFPRPVPATPPLSPGWGLAGSLPINNVAIIGSTRGPHVDASTPIPHTWHLSVINAGQPRSAQTDAEDTTWMQAAYLSGHDWERFEMATGSWTFGNINQAGRFEGITNNTTFGTPAGLPLAGDFDGDSLDEVAIYKDGYWLIDINGNGRWDRDDLLAKLGDADDAPVVGDWDGDGKDDIGIYGPIWEGDQRAIVAEPGLPDADNQLLTRPKNVPPAADQAAEGARVLKLGKNNQSRIDVIDHVFGYGDDADQPVVGDWNGDGIRSIGYYRAGQWKLDLDGDGRFDGRDAAFAFGQTGDLPLVGDFNGDGIDEVAIYSSGTWIIDANGNRQIDAADLVFELGGTNDLPVVGDWNADGIDDPAIFNTGMQANQLKYD